jgi:hypothetical protein
MCSPLPAGIYLTGPRNEHISFFVTYIPQLTGKKMYYNYHNKKLDNLVKNKNIKLNLNVKFYNDDNSASVESASVESGNFSPYTEILGLEGIVLQIDAISDEDSKPVGIIFGPDSSLGKAFLEIIDNRNASNIKELPNTDKSWSNTFHGVDYVVNATNKNNTELEKNLINKLSEKNLINKLFPQQTTGGKKKDSSIKSLIRNLKTLIDKL